MKRLFLPILSIPFVALLAGVAVAQPISVTRPKATYHANDAVDPETLMAQASSSNMSRRGYIVVEGYIDYVAGTISDTTHTTKVGTEADGDFHFEMQTTNALRPGGESPNGLVCEIDPALQLVGWDALSKIDRKDPTTYRKVRVYGWLRFGTESGHSGVKNYNLGNGKSIKGHWEIHPVEKVEAIDSGTQIQIGPTAKYVSWPIAERYKVTNTNFASAGPSNYAKIVGKVERVAPSADKSGDVDVWLRTGQRRYVATVPSYYVSAFDRSTQTLSFVHLPNFASLNYSLRPSETMRTFFGLRNWKFRLGTAFPALQPVEIIQ